jgi:hypothetical protein
MPQASQHASQSASKQYRKQGSPVKKAKDKKP